MKQQMSKCTTWQQFDFVHPRVPSVEKKSQKKMNTILVIDHNNPDRNLSQNLRHSPDEVTKVSWIVKAKSLSRLASSGKKVDMSNTLWIPQISELIYRNI